MDCSTFAFDLHVLGTPPALILSQDQTLMLKAFAAAHLRALRRSGETSTELFNARPIGSALFNPLLVSWSPPAAIVRTDNSGRPILRRHALTLCLLPLRTGDGLVCACTHYLVFKEPTVCAPVAPSPLEPLPAVSPTAFRGTF